MRRLSTVIIALLIIPTTTIAANVGFVPSTGIWFSRTEFKPGETIRVYTAIMNNDYHSLEGAVVFYDNGEVIDTVVVQGLTKESARQLRVFWQPEEGKHGVTAKFTKAVAVDEQGNKKELDVGTINSIAGAPLSVGEEKLYPVQETNNAPVSLATTNASAADSGANATALGEVQLVVKKQGDKLVLSAPSSQTRQGGGVETPGAGVSTGETAENFQDPFAKNREALAKAEQVADTITTTAGKIISAYEKTKSAVAEGKGYYEKGKERWNKTVPYVKKAEPFWNAVSNNNEPKRVVIIIGGIIFLWLLFKWWIRRRRRRKYREEFED